METKEFFTEYGAPQQAAWRAGLLGGLGHPGANWLLLNLFWRSPQARPTDTPLTR